MQTHEYAVAGTKSEELCLYANQYAKNGWRLVSTYKDPYDRSTIMMVFERPVSNTSTMSRDLANNNI